MDDTTPDPRHTLSLPPMPDRRRLGAPLPAPLTPLIGRTAEVAAVAELVAHGTRLITLIGPGGVGKTRLALAIAAESAAAFPDGVCLVTLQAILDPALVIPTIIQSLEPRVIVDESPVDQLADLIGDRRVLLVLDNLEQVLDAGQALSRLLAACRNLTILATSRVVLRLSGEHVVPVAPLSIPDWNAVNDPTHVAAYGAVELFVQRARAADPAFALSAANAPIVADIVRRLDGLPLAIELAADRVRSLPPDAILDRLDDRLRLLTGGARDLHDRQRTMRDTIAWSYDLLPPHDQVLFRRLGVFVGGFPLAAVEMVTGPQDRTADPVDGVTALVDASLHRKLDHPTAPRYAMLETVRAFAREQLEASGELDETSRAHAEWCIKLAEVTTMGLWGEAPADALERLPAEHDNIRAALGWAIGNGETEIALRLVSACARFWHMFGHFREGRRWASRALSLPGAASPVYRGRAIIVLASLSNRFADPDEAFLLAGEGLAIAEAAGDQVGKGRALTVLSHLAIESGDYTLANTYSEEILDLARAIGDPRWEQQTLGDLGLLAYLQGDHARATALYQDALPIARALDDRILGMRLASNLAAALALTGEMRRAAELWREVLVYAREFGFPEELAITLSDIADEAVHAGRAEAAARLLGASDALRAATGVPVARSDLDGLADLISLVRERMDEATFVASWEAGASLPLDDAVAEAEGILAGIIDAPAVEISEKQSLPGSLTPREVDVVRLLAAGKSNREIADALYIGHSTAITHVRHVLRKLDLDSRAAVAAWAVRHGLA